MTPPPKPKYSFSIKMFAAGLVAVAIGLGLAYWQYLIFFDPETVAENGVRHFVLPLAGAAFLFIAGGAMAIFKAFQSGAVPILVLLPKELYGQAKKAVESCDPKEFEKLLEGSPPEKNPKESTALSIEYFPKQPDVATVMCHLRTLHSSGQFYETLQIVKQQTVGSPILEILKKIEEKYESREGY